MDPWGLSGDSTPWVWLPAVLWPQLSPGGHVVGFFTLGETVLAEMCEPLSNSGLLFSFLTYRVGLLATSDEIHLSLHFKSKSFAAN